MKDDTENGSPSSFAAASDVEEEKGEVAVLPPDATSGKSPVWYACVHIATMQIGPVLLALPHAYAALSLWWGLGMHAAVAIVALINTKLLSKLWLSASANAYESSSGQQHLVSKKLSRPDTPALENREGKRKSSNTLSTAGMVDYYDIAELVGGERLRKWVVGVQLATLAGTAIGEIIAVGQTMYLVFPHSMDSLWWILLAGFFCTLIGFIPGFHSFILLSVIGLTGTISSAIVIFVASMVEKVPSAPQPHDVEWSEFLQGISTIVFMYAGAAVLPSIQGSMAKPRSFYRAYSISWIYSFLVTAPSAFAAVYHFGAASITGNVYYTLHKYIGQSTGLDIAIKFGEISMSIHALAAYGIFILPVMMIAERTWLPVHPDTSSCAGSVNGDAGEPFLRSGDAPARNSPGCEQRQPGKFQRILLRTLISLFCCLVAAAFPFFAQIQSLIGATTSSLLTFIFPIAFYLKLRWNFISSFERYFLSSIMFLMIAVAFIGGTIASLIGVIESASSYSIFPLCYQCSNVTSVRL